MFDFIEEMNYKKGEDEKGRPYFEIDAHHETPEGRKFHRYTYSEKGSWSTTPVILLQERTGNRLSEPFEIPVGCLPAHMTVLVELMKK
jgi:hypothetical protein